MSLSTGEGRLVNLNHIVMMMALVFFSLSCGQRSSSEDAEEEREEVFQSGLYMIDFETINPGVTGYLRPEGMMWIKEDQFYVKIVMRVGQPKIRYQQYFHSNGICPGPLNDRNGDGTIDYYENFAISGKVLFPLDKNLSSHLSGNEWFPVANKKGIYSYSKAVSINKLVEGLRNEQGGRVLGASEQLEPERRVIILYGSHNDPLLPVACGKIKKNRNLPLD